MKEHIFTLTKKDFDIQTFRSGGKGGQNQNKRDTGVRIIHRASGATGESRSERSQLQNKKLAFKRLTDSQKFKTWINRMVWELTQGKTIEQRVDEAIHPKNLKIETKEEGKWQRTENLKD